jgi:hypothetical protein
MTTRETIVALANRGPFALSDVLVELHRGGVSNFTQIDIEAEVAAVEAEGLIRKGAWRATGQRGADAEPAEDENATYAAYAAATGIRTTTVTVTDAAVSDEDALYEAHKRATGIAA